jgi:hypothetical protein
MAPDAVDPQLRIGHSERDEAAAVLQRAAAEGRLSLEELDERLDAALRAKTHGDLRPLIADLSVNLPSSVPQGPPPPGYAPEDPLRLEGGMSSEKRTGVWTMPPYIRINQGMGSVKLNCLQAEVVAPITEIEMIGGAGSTLIVLPEGWGVDADRLSKGWGTKTIKMPRHSAAGMPLLVVHGNLGMGSFKIRPATERERRRSER